MEKGRKKGGEWRGRMEIEGAGGGLKGRGGGRRDKRGEGEG